MPELAVDQAFLARLSSLRSLALRQCPSLFHLHNLSRLQRLEQLTLTSVPVADLTPNHLPQQSARPGAVFRAAAHQRHLLAQLRSLQLVHTDSTLEVFWLSTLTKLELQDVRHVSALSCLQELRWFGLHRAPGLIAAGATNSVIQQLLQLPSLQELSLVCNRCQT